MTSWAVSIADSVHSTSSDKYLDADLSDIWRSAIKCLVQGRTQGLVVSNSDTRSHRNAYDSDIGRGGE